jgi:hypothetical protein
MIIRDAFISGHFLTAETLLTQEIDTDAKINYISYANLSFLMA